MLDARYEKVRLDEVVHSIASGLPALIPMITKARRSLSPHGWIRWTAMADTPRRGGNAVCSRVTKHAVQVVGADVAGPRGSVLGEGHAWALRGQGSLASCCR